MHRAAQRDRPRGAGCRPSELDIGIHFFLVPQTLPQPPLRTTACRGVDDVSKALHTQRAPLLPARCPDGDSRLPSARVDYVSLEGTSSNFPFLPIRP